jgi:pimeloyl-ACP methyl ester carboxylesterase
MPNVTANGIQIEYESFGDTSNPPLLLIMGLGAQMIVWDTEFCQRLADRGFHIIRFDNRDVGLSTHFHEAPAPDVMAAMAGDTSSASYTLSDMAADAAGLLDALGIPAAHIVGASMGGMIVQTMAIEHPDRVLTMTSIMSTTGEQGVGQPAPEAIQMLMTPPPTDRAEYIEGSVRASKVIGSPRYNDEARIRAHAAEAFDRAFYPDGTNRQLAAVVASGSRADGLRRLQVPTLVIHGRADRLIQLSGGERTAELVPGANLLVMQDMGHDLPEPLWPLVVDVIASHTTHAI